MENNQKKSSDFAIIILLFLFILELFRLFRGKNSDKTEKLNEQRSPKRKFLKSLSIWFALANIPVLIITFTVDKVDNLPFIQSLLTSRENLAMNALQKIKSNGIINHKDEGFYELRYYAVEEIKKSPNFKENKIDFLTNYPIFYAVKDGVVALSDKGFYQPVVFRSLCCNFHLSIEQISQKIEQAKKDAIFGWARFFLFLNVLLTSISVIINSLLLKE